MPIFFRATQENRYSLSALAGILSSDSELNSWKPSIFTNHTDTNGPLEYKGSEPLVIAYSFMSTALDNVGSEIEQLKKEIPNAVYIAGGPHPSGDPCSVLGMGFDIAFVGEAEITFPLLLKSISSNINSIKRPSIINGASPSSLDPYPPFDTDTLGFTPIEISRGCPYGCLFCQTSYIFGRKMRHRSIDVLKLYFEKMAIGGKAFLRFITPNSFGYKAKGNKPDEKEIEGLLKTARNAGINEIYLGTFPGEVRPDYCTDGVLSLVKDYCKNKRIVIGAQSGSDRVNNLLKRGHSVKDIWDACERTTNHGFKAYVDILFGLPGEEPCDSMATLKLAQDLICTFNAKIHAHYFIPLPGTPIASEKPTPLPDGIREEIFAMEDRGELDGDWKEQENMAVSLPNMVKKWSEKSPTFVH